MKTEPDCRLLVLQACGVSNVDAAAVPDVETEREKPDTTWRADVVITWSGGAETWVELKLWAELNANQRAQELQIGLLVVPERRVVREALPPRISWRALAKSSSNPLTRALLEQVEDDANVLVERQDGSVLAAELRQFAAPGGKPASWPGMYRTLLTLDVLLRDRVASYRPSPGWSKSRRDRYYGYRFTTAAGPKRSTGWWLGFSDETTGPALVLYRGHEFNAALTFPLEGVLETERISDRIANHLRAA